MQIDMQTAGTLVAGYLTIRFLGKAFDYFFDKVAKDKKYVTCEECNQLREQCSQSHSVVNSEIMDELKTIRGVLFLLAHKAQLKPEEYKELTQ